MNYRKDFRLASAYLNLAVSDVKNAMKLVSPDMASQLKALCGQLQTARDAAKASYGIPVTKP